MTQSDLEKKLAELDKEAAATDRRTAKLSKDVERLKASNGELLERAAEVRRRLAKAS
jgi:chromosome segregation ATPase